MYTTDPPLTVSQHKKVRQRTFYETHKSLLYRLGQQCCFCSLDLFCCYLQKMYLSWHNTFLHTTSRLTSEKTRIINWSWVDILITHLVFVPTVKSHIFLPLFKPTTVHKVPVSKASSIRGMIDNYRICQLKLYGVCVSLCVLNNNNTRAGDCYLV